jgi:hypothetical protein
MPTTTTPSQCDGDDALNLEALCSGCTNIYTVANPNCQQEYILCNVNGMNSIQKCGSGLLFDSQNLTCDYAGLVS